MSVVILSLYPLDATGGGELFTLHTAQAVRAIGDEVIVAAPVNIPPPRADLKRRLATPFVLTSPGARTDDTAVMPWADVLARLADHDHIWVHQYLAADLVFDAIGSTASDQHLLFTSLGFENISELFAAIYQPSARQHFIEISGYAAGRARRFGRRATSVTAAIWRSEMAPLGPAACDRDFLALGRVLPHKGLETTIDALSPDETLHVVGPQPDTAYAAFLRARARGKNVLFHGPLSQDAVRQRLADTAALVSASTHQLFDGRRIEQPELLGLVLCEALREGTLPLASAVPAFEEVMSALGLAEWTFPEGDAGALRLRLSRAAALDPADRQQALVAGRRALEARFAWDDYWPRVQAQIEELSACA